MRIKSPGIPVRPVRPVENISKSIELEHCRTNRSPVRAGDIETAWSDQGRQDQKAKSDDDQGKADDEHDQHRPVKEALPGFDRVENGAVGPTSPHEMGFQRRIVPNSTRKGCAMFPGLRSQLTEYILYYIT